MYFHWDFSQVKTVGQEPFSQRNKRNGSGTNVKSVVQMLDHIPATVSRGKKP